MLARARFWLYRNIIGTFILLSFRSSRVEPLAPPADGSVDFAPFGEVLPGMPIKGLYLATTFPPGDRADKRMRRIKGQTKLLALVKRIAPRDTPPVVTDGGFARPVYPRAFRKAWPAAPTPPATVAGARDLVAELAVRGPFASYLRREDDGRYAIDVDWLATYPAAPALARPGGRAVFRVEDGRLVTDQVGPDGLAPEHARAAFLAGLNEDMTTFRHNVAMHLAILTPFALASTNHLDARHPVRRLLHHCFNTVLIGNVELSSAQLSGTNGFSATIFSHRASELCPMIEGFLERLDMWDYEPDAQFRARGTTETPFEYPYRDNTLRLWTETKAYVERYLGLYYDGDTAAAKDPQLVAWAAALDRLVPNGVSQPIGGLTLDWLARLCATLIHVSTVEHDYVNNVVWNYLTVVPTVVPLDGRPMDQRRAFDLVATLIPTWKPYNMLLTSDVPSLALDDRAAAVMTDWIQRLQEIQDEMTAAGPDPTVSYPANLNVSVSN